MLLAGQIVALLAVLDIIIGLTCVIFYFVDPGEWREVAAKTPFFQENIGAMGFLVITFGTFMVTGLLEFLATCSNNRILWWFSLLGKIGLLGCSGMIGFYVFTNNMRSEEFLERHVAALVDAYNSSQAVAYTVDWIHTFHLCCGYRSDHAEWINIFGPDTVPISCCIRADFADCGRKNNVTGAWLIRINNAACQKVMWQAYETWDPLALLIYLIFVYLMWLGVLLNFYKVFLASYLASEVAKYLGSMDTLNE